MGDLQVQAGAVLRVVCEAAPHPEVCMVFNAVPGLGGKCCVLARSELLAAGDRGGVTPFPSPLPLRLPSLNASFTLLTGLWRYLLNDLKKCSYKEVRKHSARQRGSRGGGRPESPCNCPCQGWTRGHQQQQQQLLLQRCLRSAPGRSGFGGQAPGALADPGFLFRWRPDPLGAKRRTRHSRHCWDSCSGPGSAALVPPA